ncbi:MAG: methyltransferase domain-containing protein [Microbacterium enclense]
MNADNRTSWAGTRTFFPLVRELALSNGVRNALVAGASDGKFVYPLLEAGMNVTALDIDAEALARIRPELEASGTLTILVSDIADLHQDGRFDLAWTSCSWHYSRNFATPLSTIIGNLANSVTPRGIFAAEYMMPVDVKHVDHEHYLEPGEVWAHLPGWKKVWEAYTPTFVEDPHPGQPYRHVHRMGLAIAARDES